MLLSDSCGVDVPHLVDCQAGDLSLRRTIENEYVALGSYAIDEAAAIRAGNQISLRIECEHADVRLIAFEKKRVLAIRRNTKDFAMVSGRDIQIAAVVESEAPDVFGLGVEEEGRTPFACSVQISAAGFRFQFVNLAIGIRCGVEHATFVYDQSLHLQLLRLKNRDRLTS